MRPDDLVYSLEYIADRIDSGIYTNVRHASEDLNAVYEALEYGSRQAGKWDDFKSWWKQTPVSRGFKNIKEALANTPWDNLSEATTKLIAEMNSSIAYMKKMGGAKSTSNYQTEYGDKNYALAAGFIHKVHPDFFDRYGKSIKPVAELSSAFKRIDIMDLSIKSKDPWSNFCADLEDLYRNSNEATKNNISAFKEDFKSYATDTINSIKDQIDILKKGESAIPTDISQSSKEPAPKGPSTKGKAPSIKKKLDQMEQKLKEKTYNKLAEPRPSDASPDAGAKRVEKRKKLDADALDIAQAALTDLEDIKEPITENGLKILKEQMQAHETDIEALRLPSKSDTSKLLENYFDSIDSILKVWALELV